MSSTRKLQRGRNDKYPVPTLYDCAGSANFRNKADNGLVVWRELSVTDSEEVQLHVQKIRFRHVGKRGMCPLYYEPACATYREARAQEPAREPIPVIARYELQRGRHGEGRPASSLRAAERTCPSLSARYQSGRRRGDGGLREARQCLSWLAERRAAGTERR